MYISHDFFMYPRIDVDEERTLNRPLSDKRELRKAFQ
jgi:hypothetical protein